MGVSLEQIINAKCDIIIREIESDPKNSDTMSTALIQQFNELVQKAGAEWPDIREHLPAVLSTDGPFAQIGRVPISKMDFKILVEQLKRIVALATN